MSFKETDARGLPGKNVGEPPPSKQPHLLPSVRENKLLLSNTLTSTQNKSLLSSKSLTNTSLESSQAASVRRQNLLTSLRSERPPNLSNRFLSSASFSSTQTKQGGQLLGQDRSVSPSWPTTITTKATTTFCPTSAKYLGKKSPHLSSSSSNVVESIHNVSSDAATLSETPNVLLTNVGLEPTKGIAKHVTFEAGEKDKQGQNASSMEQQSYFINDDDFPNAAVECNWKNDLLGASFDNKQTTDTLAQAKEDFVRMASVSLVGNPNLENGDDPTRRQLVTAAEEVAEHDPEFVLKVALYCRHELNIRTTANLLLAFASIHSPCRPHLFRYFGATVSLPTDWVSVANLVQTFHDSGNRVGSLPAVLRRAMVAKFAEFDEYQLAKHNHKGTKKKAQKNDEDVDMDTDEEGQEKVDPEVVEQRNRDEKLGRRFTIKRLIRLLHINEPVFHVMAILGKKYPLDHEEFHMSRLPGVFEAEKAGTRLKLPIPETWETHIAKYGNKASVWEELIDNKRLPYMATLRNLRNMVMSGVDKRHVDKVTHYIGNEKAVVNSKMFPFRYMTAYNVLEELRKFGLKAMCPPRREDEANHVVKKHIYLKMDKRKETMNWDSIELYRYALNRAVEFSTRRNIPPLQGRILILCAAGQEMNQTLGGQKSRNTSNTARQSAFLFSLMCCVASEEPQFYYYDDKGLHKADGYDKTSVSLKNLEKFNLLAKAKEYSDMTMEASSNSQMSMLESLKDMVTNRQWFDTIVLVHGELEEQDEPGMKKFLELYRQLVNPRLVFADIDICGGKVVNVGSSERHPNDIHMAGFSETIFHCLVASSLKGGQRQQVENIDKKYKLLNSYVNKRDTSLPHNDLTSTSLIGPRWKRVRIFISSTFRDMHGERDMLNQFVLPELSRRARGLYLEVVPVDLRWGVSSSLSPMKQVQTCLQQIDSCDLFVAILGERYGWKPPVEESKNLDILALRLRERGCNFVELGQVSITELEMEYGALAMADKVQETAFFFLRDSRQLDTQLPVHIRPDFYSDCEEDMSRLENLKHRVRTSGLEVMDGYPALFGGMKNDVPYTVGLEHFAKRMLDILWNALQKVKGDQQVDDNTPEGERLRQVNFAQNRAHEFLGRAKLLKNSIDTVRKAGQNNHDPHGGFIEVTGKEGCGTTSLVAKIYNVLVRTSKQRSHIFIPFFVEATPNGGLSNTGYMLTYLHYHLKESLCVPISEQDHLVPTSDADMRSLSKNVATLLNTASSVVADFKLILILDGLESLSTASGSNLPSDWLEWLPSSLSKGITLVITTQVGSKWNRWLSGRRDKIQTIKVDVLDVSDRKLLARQYLAFYGKTLNEAAFDNQLTTLTSKREAGNVAYLRMLCSEMANFGIFEGLASQLSSIGQTSKELLQQILARLENDVGFQTVSEVLCLLYISDDTGLTESRLTAALQFSGHEQEDTLKLAMLLNGLDLFLQPTAGSLMEGILLLKKGKPRDIVKETYIRPRPDAASESHKNMALVYMEEYQHCCSLDSAFIDPKVIQALPLHLALSGQVKELEQSLCNLTFVQHSAQAGEAVLSNLQLHLEGHFLQGRVSRDRMASSSLAKAYAMFVKKYSDVLLAQPCLAIQTAFNQPPNDIMHKEALKAMSESSKNVPEYLLAQQNVPKQEQDLQLAKLNLSPLDVTVSAVETMETIDYDDLLAAHGFSDGSILVSLASVPTKLFTLIGHSAPVSALTFLSGSKHSGDAYLVSGSDAGEICFWDLNTRIRLASIKAHARRVSGLASSTDGLTLVSVGWDGNCKIWSGRGRREISSLKQADGPLSCVVFHPEKDFIVVGSWDKLVKVWDLTKLERRAVLRGHNAAVQDVKMTSDARRIVSADIDGHVCVFDGLVGAHVGSFDVGQSIFSLMLDRSNTSVFVGCRDGQIQKWILQSTQPLNKIDGQVASKATRILFEDDEPMIMGDVCKHISALCCLDAKGTKLLIGYDNGDLHVFQQDTMTNSMWKISSDAIKRIQKVSNHTLLDTDDTSAMDTSDRRFCAEDTLVFITTEEQAFALVLDSQCQGLALVEFVNLTSTLCPKGDTMGLTKDCVVVGCADGKLLTYPATKYPQFTGGSATRIEYIKVFDMSNHMQSVSPFPKGHDTDGLFLLASENEIQLIQVLPKGLSTKKLGRVMFEDQPSFSVALTSVEGDKAVVIVTFMGSAKLKAYALIKNTYGGRYEFEPKSDQECDQEIDCLFQPEFRDDKNYHSINYYLCKHSNNTGFSVRTNKGSEVYRFAGSQVSYLASSLAYVDPDGFIVVRDIFNSEFSGQRLLGHSDKINCVASVSSGGKYTVLSSARDSSVRFWAINEQEQTDEGEVVPYKPSLSRVVGIVNLPKRDDAVTVLTLSQDGLLSHWSLRNDERLDPRWTCTVWPLVFETKTALAAVQLPAEDHTNACFLATTTNDNLFLWYFNAEKGAHEMDKTPIEDITCCDLVANRVSATKWVLYVTVGTLSGNVYWVKATTSTYGGSYKAQSEVKLMANYTGLLTSLHFITDYKIRFSAMGKTSETTGCQAFFTCSALLKDAGSCLYGDTTGKVHLHRENQPVCVFAEQLHEGCISAVVYLKSEQTGIVVATSSGNTIRLWQWDEQLEETHPRQVGEFLSSSGLPITALASSPLVSVLKFQEQLQHQKEQQFSRKRKMMPVIPSGQQRVCASSLLVAGDSAGEIYFLATAMRPQ